MNQTEICNLALSRVSEERIEQVYPGEDSRLARLMSEVWDPARQFCLAGVNYPWAFAMAEVELVELNIDHYRWAHVYQVPPGTLEVLRLSDASGTDEIPFERIGQQFYSNHGGLWLRYIIDHQVPTNWPPYFAETLAWRLAMDIAIPITTDQKKREYCEQRFGLSLGLAIAADERHSYKAVPETNPYVEAHQR